MVILIVALTFHSGQRLRNRSVVAAESFLIGVKKEFVFSFLRNTDPKILSSHRRHVQHYKNAVLSVFRLTNVAVNTAVLIVGIHPLESVPAVIQFIECRIFVVDVENFLHVVAHAAI